MSMHFSGVINSKESLVSTIISNLITFGFVQIDQDLHYETLAIRFTNQTNKGGSTLIKLHYTDGEGTILSSNPNNVGLNNNLPYPLNYELYCYDDPLECYLILNFNSEFYMHSSFGLTTLYGGKWPWLNTPYSLDTLWSTLVLGTSLYVDNVYLVVAGAGSNRVHQGIFSATSSDLDRCGTAIYTEATTGNPTWITKLGSSLSAGYAPASGPTAVLHILNNTPSAIDGSAILAPIYAVTNATAYRRMIVANTHHSRFTRNDNILPGQTISYGEDNWVIYPWYRRNTSSRNGGTSTSQEIDHSGTFALALKEI